MFRILDISGKCILSCGVALTLLFPLHGARADAVLYSFNGGSDGDNPGAGLVRDSARNLYGTTGIGAAMAAADLVAEPSSSLRRTAPKRCSIPSAPGATASIPARV